MVALPMSDTILVVDDEQAVLTMCTLALRKFGYEIITAADSKTALEICRKGNRKISLALIDAVMPGLSGPELAECLRGMGIKILMMSGYTEKTIAEKLQ